MTEETIIPEGFKYCGCGCGELIEIYDSRGRERKYKRQHLSRWTHNNMWNGGITIDKRGYRLIRVPNHPYSNATGYVREHRLVMEKILMRYLYPSETVHHINGNKLDNRPENLMLCKSQAQHLIHHRKDMSGRICIDCGTNKTILWHIREGIRCHSCYCKFYRQIKRALSL